MSGRLLAGRFEIHHELGRGGMGVVWHATDTVLGRPVAVKRLHAPETSYRDGHGDGAFDTVDGSAAAAADETARDNLVREARAAARLNHPGAVTVHDVVRDEDDVYIVMEYVPAPTLAEVAAQNGPLSPDRVAAIARGLAEVLDAAHELGIVHRDIKPENVMLLPGDQVKLTDFGIARRLDDGPPGTTTVTGTPAYMAPEQIRGTHGPASDLWALGATLFHVVEGAPAFHGDTPQATIAAVIADPAPPARRAGPVLGPVIDALLIKDPAARMDVHGVRRALGGTTGAEPAVENLPEPVRASGGNALAIPTGPLPPRKLTLELPPGTQLEPRALASGPYAAVPVQGGPAPWDTAAGPYGAAEPEPPWADRQRTDKPPDRDRQHPLLRGAFIVVGLLALAAVGLWAAAWAVVDDHVVPLGTEAAAVDTHPFKSWRMGAVFGTEADGTAPPGNSAPAGDGRVLDWAVVTTGEPTNSSRLNALLAAVHAPFLLVLVAARLCFSARHGATGAALLAGGAAVWGVDGMAIRRIEYPPLDPSNAHPWLAYAPYFAACAAGLLGALVLLFRTRLRIRAGVVLAALLCAGLGAAAVGIAAPAGPERRWVVAASATVLLLGGLARPYSVAAAALGGWAFALAAKWSAAVVLVFDVPNASDDGVWHNLFSDTTHQLALCGVAVGAVGFFAVERALRAGGAKGDP